MPRSKLEEIIEILSKKEQNQFDLYLQAPFFKADEASKLLFAAIISGPFRGKEFKSELFKRVYPGMTYNDKLLRYQISDLNKHLERFLILKKIEKDEILSSRIIATVFAERDCEKSFQILNNDLSQQHSLSGADELLEQFRNAELQLNYTGKKVTAKNTPDYSSTLNLLDSFYILKKLQLSCEIVNLSNILKKSYEVKLIHEIQELSEKDPFNKIPAIQIYQNILHFLSDPNNESAFLDAQQLIISHSDKLNIPEVSELYQYLKNYCVRQINQGNADYIRKLFEIYQTVIANKPLMRNDYLSQWEFKNIVSISLRLGEKKWCSRFIEKYVTYLKPDEQKNALAYNLAYSYFIDDDFRKAIRKLQEVELKDLFYQLDGRVILLKSYFELDETESFFYQVSSFRLFLLRNKNISEYQKSIYRNLIHFLAAIMRAGTSKAKLRKIKTEVEKEKNVADINWLYTKIAIALGE